MLPAPPGRPTARALDANSVMVKWDTVVTAPKVSSYSVWIKKESDTQFKLIDSNTGKIVERGGMSVAAKAGSTMTQKVEGLEASCKYVCSISAKNDIGWGAKSATSAVVCTPVGALPTIKRRRAGVAATLHLLSSPVAIDLSEGRDAISQACPYFSKVLEFAKSLPAPVQAFLDYDKHGICWCKACHRSRGDKDVYTRGSGTYAIPVGWGRIALPGGGAQAMALDAFKKWNVAFHGTTMDALQNILGTGRLVKPGDRVAALEGKVVGIRADTGRIRKPFKRNNGHTGADELFMFDPNQIFLSPTIRYSELPQCAKKSDWEDLFGDLYDAQLAFQVRIRPGTYGVGKQTMGAKERIDPHFPNNEVEWYTTGEEHGSLILTGLMIQLSPQRLLHEGGHKRQRTDK